MMEGGGGHRQGGRGVTGRLAWELEGGETADPAQLCSSVGDSIAGPFPLGGCGWRPLCLADNAGFCR